MKKVKIVNFNESGFIGLARQMLSNEIHKSGPIMDFKCSILLKAQIHEISENCQFQ